jgi:hypothetical protein
VSQLSIPVAQLTNKKELEGIVPSIKADGRAGSRCDGLNPEAPVFAPVSNGPSWIYPVLMYLRLSANLSSTCYPPFSYLISLLDIKVCLLIDELHIPAKTPLTCCASHHPPVPFSRTETLIRHARCNNECRIGSWSVCHWPIEKLRRARQGSRSLWCSTEQVSRADLLTVYRKRYMYLLQN